MFTREQQVKREISLIRIRMTKKKEEEKRKCKAQIRLHEIERELDKTDLREIPPYRNNRRKLNREKTRLRKKLGLYFLPKDPRPNPFPTPRPTRIKIQIKRILRVLESPIEKKWKQRNFERESYSEW